MIRLGILVVRSEKTGIFDKLLRPVQERERFRTQTEIVVAELKWTKEELLRMPRWIRKRIYQAGVRVLEKNKCIKIAPEQNAQEAIFGEVQQESGFYLPIPPKWMHSCLFDLIPKYSGAVYLRTSRMDFVSKELLSLLCPVSESMYFYTDDKKRAEVVIEHICDEYGFYPEQIRDERPTPLDGLWIDLDRGAFGIGTDILADGMECRIDTHDYQVAQEKYWSGVELCAQNMVFVSWCKGKKRLTTS